MKLAVIQMNLKEIINNIKIIIIKMNMMIQKKMNKNKVNIIYKIGPTYLTKEQIA